MREAIVFFFATLLLVGAPAILMIEELSDPACAHPVDESENPFRSLAVIDHPFARCLGDFPEAPSDERLALAAEGRALLDPTW